MSSKTAPAPAKTMSGAPLPLVSLPQGELLTVAESDVPLIHDALGEGIHFKPLRLDLERNEWVVLATFKPGAEIALHYHTGPAEVYTLQGCWMYKEYQDQPQTPGSYLYEPGGSVHTFFAPADNPEDTIILVRVAGANINLTRTARSTRSSTRPPSATHRRAHRGAGARDPYTVGISGVYLCSAATPPGAGAHGMCGYNAAQSALRRLGPARREQQLDPTVSGRRSDLPASRRLGPPELSSNGPKTDPSLRVTKRY
jgi:quercetin dioxygenase-like cupin family protein